MKKILALGISLMIVVCAFAQSIVENGSNASYTVSATSGTIGTIQWTMDGTIGSITSGATSTTVNVHFTGTDGDQGFIRVSAISPAPASCPGPQQSREYRLVAPGTITITATLGVIANLCPYDATTNATGGDIPNVTINFSENVTSYSYSIDDGVSIPVDVTPAANSSSFNPATQLSTAGVHTITIKSITASGSTYNFPTTAGYIPSRNVTVETAPVLSTW